MAESENTVTTVWLMQRDRYLEGLRDINVQTQATIDRFDGSSITIAIEGMDGVTPIAEQAIADCEAMEAEIAIEGEDDLTAAVDAAIEANSGKSVTVNIEGADDTAGGGGGGVVGMGAGRIGRMAGMMMLYAGIREIDEKMKANSEEAERLAGNHQDAVKNAQKELEAFDKLHSGVLGIDPKDAGNYKYSMMDPAPGANYNPNDPDRPSAEARKALVDALDNAKEVEERARINARNIREADRERAKVAHEQSVASIAAMPTGAGRDRAIAEEGLKLAKEQAKLMDDTGKAGAERAKEFMVSAQKVYDDQMAKADALDKKDADTWAAKMQRQAEQFAREAHADAAEDARNAKQQKSADDKVGRDAEELHRLADAENAKSAKAQERQQHAQQRHLDQIRDLESSYSRTSPSFSSDPFQTWIGMQRDKDGELKEAIDKLNKQLDDKTVFGAVVQ